MSRVVLTFACRTIYIALLALGLAHTPQVQAAWHQGISISGSPAVTGTVGSAYSFTPTVTPPGSERFWIKNKPAWATFDASSGHLSGTPTGVGTYSNIRIAVTEGRAWAALAPFSITVTAASGTATDTRPTISGSPTASINEGSSYTFTPTAKDADNDPLSFSVQNLPSWASFSTKTGTLSGTPASASVGTYANIVISVSDGKLSASLPAFSIAVTQTSNGAATVSWLPPTQNTDGSTLTDLSGYKINYGTSQGSLDKSIQIPNPGTATYTVTNLSAGTWYFDVVAYTSGGTQSSASTLASKVIN